MRLSLSAAKRMFPKIAIHVEEGKPKRKRQPPSGGEERFVLHCRARMLPMFKRQFKFAIERGRGWMFDFAWPEFKVAVEIEGLVVRRIQGETYCLGRHASITGFQNDCIKYATANELGWHVNRFNQALVKNMTAIDMTEALLRSRGWTL